MEKLIIAFPILHYHEYARYQVEHGKDIPDSLPGPFQLQFHQQMHFQYEQEDTKGYLSTKWRRKTNGLFVNCLFSSNSNECSIGNNQEYFLFPKFLESN